MKPLFPWIVGGNIFAFVLFGVAAVISFPSWIAMFDAFMSGACLAAALDTFMLERMARQLRNLGEVCGILHESNVSLIAALEERDSAPSSSPDDVPGLRPRLH